MVRALLILILASTALDGQLFGQNQNGDVPSRPEQKGRSASDETGNQIGTAAHPAVIEIKERSMSESQVAEERRKNATTEYRETWTFRFTFFSVIINALLLVVGAVGVAVALSTLRKIRDQTEATKASVDTMLESERAWVLVEMAPLPEFTPNPESAELLWIFTTIKNYGKTPARITRVRGIVKLLREGEPLPTTPEYTLGQGFDDRIDLVLPPGGPVQPKLGITAQELIDVQAQKLTLYIHGIVEYLDLGNRQRRSAYCYVYVVQRGFSPHKTGFYPVFDVPLAYTECI